MSFETDQLPPLDQRQSGYRPGLTSIAGITWEGNPQTFQFTAISGHVEALAGHSQEQWLAKGFWEEHLHPDDRAWVLEFCRQQVAQQQSYECQYRLIAADGQVIVLRQSGIVTCEAGIVTKLSGVIIKLTSPNADATLWPQAASLAYSEHFAHLWFLESLEKVNRAMQGSNDLEQVMHDVLDSVLLIFQCDRAWLLYPCDPNVASWQAVIERTRPEYPGAFIQQVDVRLDPHHARFCQTMLVSRTPIKFGAGSPYPLSAETVERFGVQAAIVMAIRPKTDQPYIFGLHQCSYARTWTLQEERLFQEIGQRLTDTLTGLLAFRSLRASEQKLEKAQHIAHVGYWERDFETEQISLSSEACQIFGLPAQTQFHNLAEWNQHWEQLIHPEDRAFVIQAAAAALQKNGPPYQVEYRVVWPNGEIRTVLSQADVAWDEAGRAQRMFGILQDITELRQAEHELHASEARFRAVVDHAADGVFLQDRQGNLLDVNRQACESLGYSRAELLSLSATDFDVDLTPAREQETRARLRVGEIVAFDTRYRRKDGALFPVEVRISAIGASDPGVAIALVRDMTERKRAESALTLFRSLIDHINDGIEIIDPETERFLDVNEQSWRAHGYTRAEYLALTVADVDPLIASGYWQKVWGNQPWTGPRVFESQHRRKDGSLFPVEVNINYVQLDRAYLIALVRDITQRKQAEKTLKESEERYRTLFEDNPSMYFIIEEDGTVSSVNRFGAEHLGYTVNELLGQSVLHVFHPEDKAAALQAVHHCINHLGELFHWSLRKVHKDGSIMWVDEIARAMRRADGSILVLVVCEDISERKRTEQALLESHNLLNAVVDGTTDAVYVKDLQGHYLMINSAGARFLGKPVGAVIGKHDQEFFPPDIVQLIVSQDHQVILSTEPLVFELTVPLTGMMRTFLTTKGVYRDAHGEVIGIIGVARDVTELKRLEEQFRQAQKMEAVGQLAGGIAHDFNNLLTVINGYSSLVYSRLSPDDPNRRRLAEIQKAGERAANLTRQLLAFSRKQVLQPQIVNVNVLLSELLQLLQRLIGEDVELTVMPSAAWSWAKVDPGQFEQAIINLAINARDAMPQGGQLIIKTADVELDITTAQSYPEVKPGQYVQVTVSDSGSGIDETIKGRIFEPFFTTKEQGKGTGLGLAMVYGFVKQSDGHIEVASEPGCGTTFTIYLPQANQATRTAKSPPELMGAPVGTETILLVEDEAAVRSFFKHSLEANGYTVLEAADGQEAVELAQRHLGLIHLLVSDLVMPRMSGRQLADTLLQTRPSLRVLFISGYTDEAVLRHGVTEGSIALLQKPFDPIDLLHKIREELNPA